MRPQDLSIFRQAAVSLKAWILVRSTNESSLKYVGEDGYAPKPISCKPKSADNEACSLAGLVVDPTRREDAFSPSKWQEALKEWWPFATAFQLGSASPKSGYAVIKDVHADRYGALTRDGKFLYGDYDLYDVVLVGHEGANLAAVETMDGQLHLRGPRFFKLQQFIYDETGVNLIQHGGQFQYKGHSDENVWVFEPTGLYRLLEGLGEIEQYYAKHFRHRRPISLGRKE